jgi:hypothetical protein
MGCIALAGFQAVWGYNRYRFSKSKEGSVSEKNRSAGITVVAVLAMIGSALFLLVAVLMAVIMFVAPTPTPNDVPLPPQLFKAFKVILPLFYAAPATWGILTAFGLLRLKNWARISTIVFSCLLILFGAFGMLGSGSFS